MSYAEGAAQLQMDRTPGAPAPAPETPLPPRVETLPGLAELLADPAAAQAQTPAPPQVPGPAPAAPPPAAAVTGIATTVAIGRFVAAGRAIQTDWGTLTAQQRADRFGTAANAELGAVGVYRPTVALAADLGAADGEFRFPTWTLALSQTTLSQASVTDASMAVIADHVYHESRHCEQWFRMARLRAGAGVAAADIATQLGIPPAAATAAAASPLTGAGQEVTEAQGWYDSVYGARAAHRRTVLTTMLPAALASQQAQAAYDRVNADPAATRAAKDAAQAAWVAAYNALQPLYAQYRALPEEADAFRTGGAVATAYARRP